MNKTDAVDPGSAPTPGSPFFEDMDEAERSLFFACVIAGAFVWYGLILGMAWMED